MSWELEVGQWFLGRGTCTLGPVNKLQWVSRFWPLERSALAKCQQNKSNSVRDSQMQKFCAALYRYEQPISSSFGARSPIKKLPLKSHSCSNPTSWKSINRYSPLLWTMFLSSKSRGTTPQRWIATRQSRILALYWKLLKGKHKL